MNIPHLYLLTAAYYFVAACTVVALNIAAVGVNYCHTAVALSQYNRFVVYLNTSFAVDVVVTAVGSV